MPTFTTIALETLLEPRIRDSGKNAVTLSQKIPKPDVVNGGNEDDESQKEKKVQAPSHIYISPALYVTPKPTPIPDSSSDPVSPSPYVVNHKRRGGAAVDRRVGGVEDTPRREADAESDLILEGDSGNCVEEEVDDNFWGRNGETLLNGENFLDPRCDSASVARSIDGVDCLKQAEIRSFVSNQGEFFDADEEFSSDGSSPNSSSYGLKIDSELRATRLNLLDEIEKRKAAEFAVVKMCSQWQKLGNLLSQNGLTFPSAPNATSTQLDDDSLEQLSQELLVTRFVAEAIGRGEAHAEAELAAEAIYQSKDQEISRLRDRLRYYEAVNHEMSQRNQEVMEVARRQRQRRKSHRRWLWSCLGLTMIVGTSVVAYSYLPQTNDPQVLPSSSNSSDASCIPSKST